MEKRKTKPAPRTPPQPKNAVALLRVDNLVKSYNNRKVVNELSYHVNAGEIVGLLGRNGAGKTTTFRMTIGMVKPDGGSISFRGQDISTLPIYMRARLGMGYLSQEPSIFLKLSVKDNIVAILENMKFKKDINIHDYAEKLLKKFGLLRLKNSYAMNLSGGERRRLEITRALATSPRLLLLDEPFSGVDPIAVADIQNIIKMLKQKGMGILLTDHNVRETLAITDRSYIVDDGKIKASGTSEELINNKLVREIYLGEHFEM